MTDPNVGRIRHWNANPLPVFEPGLGKIVERVRGRNLFFREASSAEIAAADLIFVCVNTPLKAYGEGAGIAPDLQYWERCARDIVAHSKDGTIVVEKSTLPVRTAEAISNILYANADGRRFSVLPSPEFLAVGTAVRDLQEPDRVLIGYEATQRCRDAAETLAEF